ncbi:prospero homeobox protein 2 [Esox lucius]|uniref:Prospero domain-containing protein n=2 Tax=Esox lucius TaxID=8010 RepID=A0AAY5L2S0_ESOLU|nr:prospero homeobox protein 2 [Esox lucius]XP_028981490.1 prospero homeobox protein 2 [Esox lucius]XP_028981491.1 prospero homeobox protein 2 [Esox lucius]
MNLSLSEQNMHNPSDGGLEDDKAELMIPCFRRNMFDEPITSYSNGSIISHLLRKTIHTKRALDESHFYLPNLAVSSSTMADSSQEDQSSISSRDSAAESASPGSHLSTGASPEEDRPLSDHLQAKRARVENIIRGMSGSPNSRLHGENERAESDVREAREAYRENKRKQRLPQHQEHHLTPPAPSNRGSSGSKDEECHKLKEQLQSMQRLLRQLQEKFLQVYNQEGTECEGRDDTGAENEDATTGKESGFVFPMSTDDESERTSDRAKGGLPDRAKTGNLFLTHQKESGNLQDTLKHELCKAVSESVDMVFKKISSTGLKQSPAQRMCPRPEHISVGADRKSQEDGNQEQSHTEETGKPRALEYYESTETRSAEGQTEALSLVVRKPPLSQLSSVTPTVKRPYPLHHSPFQFNYSTPLHDSQILEHLLKYGPHTSFGTLPCMPPSMDRASPDSVERPWDAIAMRSKVTSSHLAHHPCPSGLGPVTVDSLCLPHVKMECGDLQSMAERNSYMSLNIQEGLTPNHLKKAKLMFFYTRYPSSNVLKTFFPDVKFNRCITSQLIKWFSNFREFYYIQMEKFARQAIVDGVNNVKDMSVSRDSELFRALNMHYNKANDFQVPERFLEVAEITLQEFFNAISTAKDSDPSWKKAIYKVICKLDSDVPDEFKSSTCL